MHKRKCVKFILNLIISLSVFFCILQLQSMHRMVLKHIENGFISFGFLLQYYFGLMDIFSRGGFRTYPRDYTHNIVFPGPHERRTMLPE